MASNTQSNNLTTSLTTLRAKIAAFTDPQITALRADALKLTIFPSTPAEVRANLTPDLDAAKQSGMLEILPASIEAMRAHPGAEESIYAAMEAESAIQRARMTMAREGVKAAIQRVVEGADAGVVSDEEVKMNVVRLSGELEELLAGYRKDVQAARVAGSSGDVAALDKKLDESIAGLVGEAAALVDCQGDHERGAVFEAFAKAFLRVGEAHREAEAKVLREIVESGEDPAEGTLAAALRGGCAVT